MCVFCVGYFVGFDDRRVNETAPVLFHGSCREAGSQGSKEIKERRVCQVRKSFQGDVLVPKRDASCGVVREVQE